MVALDGIAKAVHGSASAYMGGLKNLLGAVKDDLEVFMRSRIER